jgi:phenylalanyl-tRNA synthetase alpha subunit
MSDLKGTLYEFARRMFGRTAASSSTTATFAEPGVEMAMDCFICKGVTATATCRDGLDRDPARAWSIRDYRSGVTTEAYRLRFGMGIERVTSSAGASTTFATSTPTTCGF